MLHLYDTATGTVRPLELRNEGEVSLYVCGPTVYDMPHIGHGRANLTFDILRRYLSFTGLKVHHVANVTDVDDNIIKRAAELGRTEADVAAEFEARWWESMEALGDLRPQDIPHATQYIEDMVALVGELMAMGKAYETPDGVYLEVSKVEGYGLLAQQSLESLRAGARVEANEDKRSPLDFALWKKAKEGEPSWDSPWGPGRPGWHTECVVMSLDLLGEGFDLHGGGQDLKFPHHENERAQAVADGKVFARHWMHNGWVEVEGTKMSKSLGNFTTLPDLLARYDARAYRVLVLRAHYRSPIEVTPETLADAEKALGRLDGLGPALRRGADAPRPDGRGIRGRGDAARHGRRLRRVGRLPGAHGRRPRHAGGAGRHLRARHGGALRRRRRRRGRGWPAGPHGCGARRRPRSVVACRRRGGRRGVGPAGGGTRRGASAPGTTPGPTPCGTSWWPGAGRWRTPPRAPPSGADRTKNP